MGLRFNCSQCDFQGFSSNTLRQHIRSTHEGVKYKCQQCDYQAKYPSQVRQHKKNVHDGIKLKCPKCDHMALKRSNLNLHIRYRHNENITEKTVKKVPELTYAFEEGLSTAQI